MEALKQRMATLEKSTNAAMVRIEESLVEMVNVKIKDIQSKLSIRYDDVQVEEDNESLTMEHYVKVKEREGYSFPDLQHYVQEGTSKFVTDWTVSKLKDLEPFMINALNTVERKLNKLQDKLSADLQATNAKALAYIDD